MPNGHRYRHLARLAAVGFATLWSIGVWGGPSRVLPLGDELSVCGLDCHLHVAVVGFERRADLSITLRFRSDSQPSRERPEDLAIRVVDSTGRTYAALKGRPAERLAPGTIIEREYRFAVPPSADPVALVAHHKDVLDYFVPGSGNPLAQRRIRLSLIGAEGGA